MIPPALLTRRRRQRSESLYHDLGDTTKIIIAQRISSVQEADQILVLEDGKIIGHGTHEEL